jgi:hypothetical protein
MFRDKKMKGRLRSIMKAALSVVAQERSLVLHHGPSSYIWLQMDRPERVGSTPRLGATNG